MLKKIIKFIKYNTMVTAVIAIAFVAVASVMAANEDMRKQVLGEEIVEKSGVDNTLLLAADLENFDMAMQITNALEDEENYYIDYQYKTLAIKDNVWREVLKQEQMTVSKASLDGRDLGLYLMEELGEVIDYQLAFLKEVQENENEKGVTVVLEKTEYTGLIGLVFNTKTKELPGYEPVVKPPVVEINDTSQDGSTQSMELTDLQDDSQTDDSTQSMEPTEPVDVPVCDSDNLDLCIDQQLCIDAGLYWYDSNDDGNEVCNSVPQPSGNTDPTEGNEDDDLVEDEEDEEDEEDLQDDPPAEQAEPINEETETEESVASEEPADEVTVEPIAEETPAEEPETEEPADEPIVE